MNTIGAKELRLNLDQVLDRALSGQDVIVQHRFKGPVRITAYRPTKNSLAKRLSGLKAFDVSPKRTPNFDVKRPLRELYDESISKKYLN